MQLAFGQKVQSTVSSEKAIPLDPLVRTGKLPNGFTYFIRHNESPKGRAVFYLANKVGSILETDEQRGLAHFTEHMSFNGTTNFPKNKLVSYLQQAGVRFGADLNAYTSFDETVYELPIPTDKPDLIKTATRIMRDWAQEALFDAEEIDKERGIILEEKRLAQSAQERMRKQYFPILLNGSRYTERSPIGTDEVLKNFKPETIKAFYKDWYRPNLQALIVVGDIDVDALEKEIKSVFGDLKNPTAEKQRTKYEVPLKNQNQFIAISDKEQTSIQIQIFIKQPAQALSTETDYRNLVMRSLYNQMLRQRYEPILLKENSSLSAVSASMNRLIANLDAFSLSANPKPEEIEKGFKTAWREIVRLKQFGFTEVELDRAKKNFLSYSESRLKEHDKTSSDKYAKEYVQYFLNGVMAAGIQKEHELTKLILGDVQLADLNRLSSSYIKNENRDFILLAPEKDKASLPNQAALESWMKQVEEEKLEPYVDVANNKSLLSHSPTPGKIIKQETEPTFNLSTLTLSNGLKVILKPTELKNDEILFTAFAKGGTSRYEDDDYQSVANATSILLSSGVGNLSLTELSIYLTGKSMQVRPYVSTIAHGMSGSSSGKDLSSALELVHAYFTAPRKDPATFKNIIDRAYTAIRSRGDDPNSVFQDSTLSVVYKDNPRMTGPSFEKLARIDQDRAFDIYKELFSDASNFTFVFVGSIDTLAMKPLLEKYLGSIPAANFKTDFKNLNIQPAKGKIEKLVYKGSEKKATVNLLLSGNFDFSTDANLALSALKEILQIRLLERLREEESGVYSPQVVYSGSKYPIGLYQYNIVFGCAPENVDKLVASALDEIEKLKNDGPSQLNVDKWKAEFSRSLETGLQSNAYWLSLISSSLQNNLDLIIPEAYQKKLDKISPQSLKETAKRYLSGENCIKMVLLPENMGTK
ncbi:MAG: insulinase family protein [Pedobacter sp.]|nr:MAG: insulinase family protein [Pedobacter sp.]